MSIFAFSANQNNGFLAYADDGDITSPELDDITFDTDDPGEPDITNVSPGVIAVVYEDTGSGDDGILKTFSVASNGDLDFIESLTFFDVGSLGDMDIIKVKDDIFAIAFEGGSDEGWIVTVEIADDGNIGSVLASLEFSVDIGSESVNITPVSRDVVAVAYEEEVGSVNPGTVKTFRIGDDGSISLVDTLPFEDEGHMHDMDIAIATRDIFAIAHVADGNHGFLTTIDIDKNGKIGKVQDRFKFFPGTGTDDMMRIIQIADGTVAVTYQDGDDGIVKTFSISSGGNISLTLNHSCSCCDCSWVYEIAILYYPNANDVLVSVYCYFDCCFSQMSKAYFRNSKHKLYNVYDMICLGFSRERVGLAN